jgi:hypothetical protein
MGRKQRKENIMGDAEKAADELVNLIRMMVDAPDEVSIEGHHATDKRILARKPPET